MSLCSLLFVFWLWSCHAHVWIFFKITAEYVLPLYGLIGSTLVLLLNWTYLSKLRPHVLWKTLSHHNNTCMNTCTGTIKEEKFSNISCEKATKACKHLHPHIIYKNHKRVQKLSVSAINTLYVFTLAYLRPDTGIFTALPSRWHKNCLLKIFRCSYSYNMWKFFSSPPHPESL